MPRNLVLCFDGTNNEFGPENTNVVRLVQVLDRDPEKQRLYYDPGVGTLPEPGALTRWGKKISKVWGLAFGTGLTRNVEEAYSYLMDVWEPGDQVFLFGFSRGAYTARVLAGLLHQLGLLPRGNQNLVPYLMRLFSALRTEKEGEGDDRESNYWRLCGQFRQTFARPVSGENRRFGVHFLGVWDTVASVGWIWNPVSYPFTRRNPSVATVRHAVSVDERRTFFRQNLFEQAETQDLQELWFPGVHSDVGGGYPEREGGLWRLAFEWMLGEAQGAGLLTDPVRLKKARNRTAPPAAPWTEPQHESLRGWKWWLAELFPKKVSRAGSPRRMPEIGLGRRRCIEDGALIHEGAVRRIRDTSYAPPNLRAPFLDQVRGLSEDQIRALSAQRPPALPYP